MLLSAKDNYQTLDNSDARAIIYQKYLLSDDDKSKLEYLVLLEDLFKKDGLVKIYPKFKRSNSKNGY